MRAWSPAHAVIAMTVVTAGACGGRVVQGALGDAAGAAAVECGDAAADLEASAVQNGDATGNAGASSTGDASLVIISGAGSCAALADCCAEFSGSEATTCNAVAGDSDDATCSDQVTSYQQQGLCQGW